VGADDYVSKPIRTSDLLAAIERARKVKLDGPAKSASEPPAQPVPVAVAVPIAAAVPTNEPAPPVFDLNGALDRVEGDRELLEEIIHIFTGEYAANMDAIRDAFSARDARLLERLAHTIKGATANLGAVALSQAAFQLEKLAASGDLSNAAEWIDKIQHEIGRLLPELASACQKVTH
ncbi:MAG TPA: Hpt domain-containing protein, partial [Candidatus Acidoferrales bacterium]|nr:Hpt domain-containing protein [Candidatus Acidoferrales bacterium]